MQSEFFRQLGMEGLDYRENHRARTWARRLNPVVIAAALLAIPGTYLELIHPDSDLRTVGYLLNVLVVGIFAVEAIVLTSLTSHRWEYLRGNWMNPLIIGCSLVSFWIPASGWVAVVRLFRLAAVSLIQLRLLRAVRRLSPSTTPFILTVGGVTLAAAGAGFYWIEPTVHSYGEGLWLAFTTGATVGYGDVVPTTAESKLFAVFMVLLGFALLSLVTASIAAFFVGEDERKMRREFHADIRRLREEVAALRALIGTQQDAPPGTSPRREEP